MERSRPTWTLEELVAQVAMALSAGDYGGAANGRVRDVPDARAVRYYTTLGLIDRPAGWQGRTALYGDRHLRQLVAIKRLQSRGLSLAQVQGLLAGADEATLARFSQQDAAKQDEAAHVPAPASDAKEKESRRARAFWSQRPAAPEAPATVVNAPGNFEARAESEERAPVTGKSSAAESHSPPPLMQGLKLGDGVTLLFEAGRALEHADLEAMSAAAAPLMKVLASRGLVKEEEKGEKR